jgi:peptidoglycan DL-endopeptidase CwlO
MDKNQGYEIIQAVMLENGRGFALGHNPAAPSPYVTWACYDDRDGQRQYEWGHYGSDRAALEQDFAARVQEYRRLYNVGVKQTEAPGLYKYYSTHDYDEYHFDLDEIKHDPYVLISMISALHEGAWTLDEVRGTLQDLFDRQYILTEDVVVEVRYRTVTRTDSEGNDYEVEVPYNYYICYVTLENFNLSHVPVYMMSEEQLSMYALYMSTLGNRPDLFPSSGYIGKYITNRPPEHEVPESYLDDETFAAILKEAEKYLGFPYVWGGSSPSTSFDCSGFASYVYNQCGWSFGRLGAQGLYNICSRTSSPRPGDLVFFVGTYDTAGISHVGIYVGDGWMLHCGDPISYANLNSSYWQSHLYAYGRLP